MSFFRLLSDDPTDYEQDNPLDECDSFQIEQSHIEDHLELILDTGEQFSVPLDWLICACRENKFYDEEDQSGWLH